MTNRQGPLVGVRVLDLGQAMPSAVASMLWADYGAEVIRVEHPSGSALRRSAGHSLWNRGKRSFVADLDESGQRAFVQSLAASADVVLEDHRPGKAAAWGLDATAIELLNPASVHCSISAYGQQGDRRNLLGTDAAVVAHLGLMAEWGGVREGPIFLGHPAINYATALLASAGTLACLRARIVSGHGNAVDVSLLDGAMSLYTMNWSSVAAKSSIDRKSKDGTLSFGNKRLILKMFECRGGDLIQVHTGAAGAFDRAMVVFGLADEISKTEGEVQMASLLSDRDLEILETRLPDILRSRSRDEWLGLLWGAEVAALPVGQPGEALDDPQTRHAGIVASLDDPELGSIELLGPTIAFAASPGAIAAPAPVLGADTNAIRSAGWESPGLPVVTGQAPLPSPMAGVRIAEFATFFAAPYSNRLLSDLGAEVVKIEGVVGDPSRPLMDIFEGANRGKVGIAANLKDERAMAVVRDLVAGVDVVQHNLRPGAAERLGIDDASLRPLNQNLIYHYLPGYGSSGPKSKLQSFAPLLSGFVGTFAIVAGAGNRPHAGFGNEDYYNGLLGATACVLGLIHRERTGQGQLVESPQLHSSLFTTSEYFKRDGRIQSVIPRMGPQLFGWAAGYRIYQCLDSWIVVTCTRDEEVRAFADLVLPDEVRVGIDESGLCCEAMEEGPLASLFEYHLMGRTVDEWCTLLGAGGVPVAAVCDEPWMSDAMFFDTELRERGGIVVFDHSSAGEVRVIGDLVRVHRGVDVRRGPAPTHGQHTREVLRSLGRTDDDVDALLADGVFR